MTCLLRCWRGNALRAALAIFCLFYSAKSGIRKSPETFSDTEWDVAVKIAEFLKTAN